MRKRWQRTRRRAWRIYNRRFRRTYATSLAHVPDRDEIPVVLNRRGLTGQGAEIGVKLGRFSDLLLRSWEGEKLISIDPWQEAEPDEYVDHANVEQDQHEVFYRRTRELLAKHGSRSEIWRTTSVEAAQRVPDRSLDFVYIDARHDYDSVLEDLEAWFPKLRAGGIMAGHDYADGVFRQGVFGVKSAVDHFFGAREITVHATDGRVPVEMFATWLIEVPRD
jgi:Methyltransferase domain